VGDLLTDLQVVLLPHGLVFDETLVLMRDPARARSLSVALFGSEKVPLHSMEELAVAPEAAPLHVGGVGAFDILRLFRSSIMMAPAQQEVVFVSANRIGLADVVAALESELGTKGQSFWWTGDHLLLVDRTP
jgi:hypothetical protein